MKYLFRDRLASGQMLNTFFKVSSDTHPDHHDYHPHFELYIRTQPLRQEITLNGESVVIDTPAVVLTAPFQIHAMSPAHPDCTRYERHIVYFNDTLIQAVSPLLPEGFFANNANCLFPLNGTDAATMENELAELFDKALPQRERALLLALLLARLDRAVPQSERLRFGQINAYVPQVLQYLYDHVAEDLGAEEIAARFHVSRAKLNRDFRASVGQTLHGAVIDLRTSRARALLCEPKLTVGEVAAACGFSSEYYFHAFFKRVMGKTPVSYRKEHLAAADTIVSKK